MANPEHLEILKQGVTVWNKWRKRFPSEIINSMNADFSRSDLSETNLDQVELIGANLNGANLHKATLIEAILLMAILNGVDLSGADLSRAQCQSARLIGANLSRAILNGVDLSGANLREADLSGARLVEADLHGANLSEAILNEAILNEADLHEANLSGANLDGAVLNGVNLSRATLSGANLGRAGCGGTFFVNVDLSSVQGLSDIHHTSPSAVGVDTLYLSKGKIPDVFLRGCGVPEDLITYLPSLMGKPIDYYSCFISYSQHDEEFAKRLHSRLRDEKLRVWFAPEDIKGGKKIFEQISNAIEYHDKLLLVLSDHSIHSEWVMTEIRRTRKIEKENDCRKLFPIMLTSYETLRGWECFDADSGKDLAIELREYFIPDFSEWKSHEKFEAVFQRLLRDLKA